MKTNYQRRAKLMGLTTPSLAALSELSARHPLPTRLFHKRTLEALRARKLAYVTDHPKVGPAVLLSEQGKKLLAAFPAMLPEETVETYRARIGA